MDGVARCVVKFFNGGDMKAGDILLKNPRFRAGYVPQRVAEFKTTFREVQRELRYQQLRTIPSKITAYFDRSKLVAAFKSCCFKNPVDNYYLLQTIDGTWFIVEF